MLLHYCLLHRFDRSDILSAERLQSDTASLRTVHHFRHLELLDGDLAIDDLILPDKQLLQLLFIF